MTSGGEYTCFKIHVSVNANPVSDSRALTMAGFQNYHGISTQLLEMGVIAIEAGKLTLQQLHDLAVRSFKHVSFRLRY
jgi:hypothetical protein